MPRTTDPRLNRLSNLADLIRDAQLQRVTAAKNACHAARTLQDSLQPAPITLDDAALLAAQLAHLRWAERRHAELAQQIIAHQAELDAARAAAAKAVARAQVLRRLRGQLS